MPRNKLIPYNSVLRERARQLRKESTLSEVLLWQKIKNRSFGVQFHRQVPMLDYIVDFYCHEIMLAIEVDGSSHDNKQEYDAKRQQRLEYEGVVFIRFLDIDIKKNMINVLESIQEKINQIQTPPSPPQGGNL
jgi:very-short-patch-repair endonuclease